MTRENGKLHEHLQYFPFGETWVSQGGNTEKSPYLFTAKELDEETGLYYFGARYYDPRTSVWVSADPILNTYLDGRINSGVYRPVTLNLYNYTAWNPLTRIDLDGKADGDVRAMERMIANGTYEPWGKEELAGLAIGAVTAVSLAVAPYMTPLLDLGRVIN